jgi:hypothetical protein
MVIGGTLVRFDRFCGSMTELDHATDQGTRGAVCRIRGREAVRRSRSRSAQ